jgi:hypothetical protein
VYAINHDPEYSRFWAIVTFGLSWEKEDPVRPLILYAELLVLLAIWALTSWFPFETTK